MPSSTQVPATRRTTPRTRKSSQSYDLDAEMLEEFGEEDEIATVDITLYGENFRLLKGHNLFALSGLGDIENDSAALQRYMLSMVHPDDRGRYKSVMAARISLNMDRLGFIMRRMTEAVADGNPSSTSSGSTRSAGRTGGKKALTAS